MRRIALALSLALVAGLLGAAPAFAAGSGSITGHLYGEGSPDVAISSVYVTAYTPEGVSVGSTLTDVNGAYALTNLAAGQYRLLFAAPAAGFWLPEWYLDSATAAGSTLTTIDSATPVVRDAVLARGGIIHGTVTTAPSHATFSAADVQVYDSSGALVTTAPTDLNGEYRTLALAAGSYSLRFVHDTDTPVYAPEWFNDAATRAASTPVVIAAGDYLERSAELAVGATISGTLYTDATETATITAAFVDLYDVATNEKVPGGPGANGAFTFGGLPAGTYAVRAQPFDPNLASMWAGGAASMASATHFTISVGQAVTGADVHETAGGSIYGNALPEDFSEQGGSVVIYEAGLGAADFTTYVGSTQLSSSGNYQVYALAPGKSYVAVFTTDAVGYDPTTGVPIPSADYLTLWNGAAPSYSTATPVTLPSSSSFINVSSYFYSNFFADVTDPRSAFWTPIRWMANSGISVGTAQPTGKPLYKPAAAVSRQAMASFLFKLSGESFTPPATPTFADVDSSNVFYTQIEWMASKGISTGTPQPTGKPLYKPADPVSRQAMAQFLTRYAGVTPGVPTSQSFADVPVSSPVAGAIEWMATAGISTGTPQPSGLPLYKPADPVSRQAMAAFLYRLDGI